MKNLMVARNCGSIASGNRTNRAIIRANPGKTKREIDILYVALHYGDDLAARLKSYLESRDNEAT